MVTPEERIKILNMLKEGKISPESAAQLLEAMGEGSQPAPNQPLSPEVNAPSEIEMGNLPDPERKPRWLRVRVTDSSSGRPKVNVRMPMGMVNLGLKIGAKFSPELQDIDMQALLQAVQAGGTGTFVDVYEEEGGEHVEVFLE